MSDAHLDQIVESAIARHGAKDGPLLPILHDIQATIGFVPERAFANLARALNLSVAEIHGVVSFYHDFRTAPPAAHIIKLCRAEACQAMGARGVEAQAQISAADQPDVAVEPVYCLGLCSCAPAALVDGTPVARLTPARIEDLIRGLGA